MQQHNYNPDEEKKMIGNLTINLQEEINFSLYEKFIMGVPTFKFNYSDSFLIELTNLIEE
jgi:hypothetical protein